MRQLSIVHCLFIFAPAVCSSFSNNLCKQLSAAHTAPTKSMRRQSTLFLQRRRQVLFGAVVFVAATTASKVNAQEALRPYAETVEALIPATRVRQQLRQAMSLAKAKTLSPPDLLALFDDDQESKSNVLRSNAVTFKLSGRTARSALNVYTANLRFSTSYVLTAEPALKKKLIRDDALPDVRAVVTADLDLRDLYRNEIQTALDDVMAELALRDPDPDEVQLLLSTASSACDSWFALIDEGDVLDAETRLAELQASGATTPNKITFRQ